MDFVSWSLNIGIPIVIGLVLIIIIIMVYKKHFPKKGDFIKALRGEPVEVQER